MSRYIDVTHIKPARYRTAGNGGPEEQPAQLRECLFLGCLGEGTWSPGALGRGPLPSAACSGGLASHRNAAAHAATLGPLAVLWGGAAAYDAAIHCRMHARSGRGRSSQCARHVSQCVQQVLHRPLPRHRGLHKQPEHRDHRQPAVLDLFHL